MVQRVLGRLRLSRDTDASTSIERQREYVQQWADLQGHEIVGWAEDIDVSGAVDVLDPKTPTQLGEWLRDRHPEFDTIACWKLDRLSRSTINLNKLFAWAIEHDKAVVSVTESVDLSTPVGRLIANVIGFLAEGELEAMRERARSSRSKLRREAQWAGGRPPYGFKAVRGDSGWTLEIDEKSSKIVRRIAAEIIAGKSLSSVVKWLNEEGYATAKGYHQTGDVKGVSAHKWSITTVRGMLQSKILLGHQTFEGNTVRDDDGEPVMICDPLLTFDEWERLQAELGKYRGGGSGPRERASLLSGLVWCSMPGCTEKLHHVTQRQPGRKDYRYYRCKEHRNIPAALIEKKAEQEFLDDWRDIEIRERIYIPGDSNEVELKAAVAALDDLTALVGSMTSATAKGRLQKQIEAQDLLIAELESRPTQQARYEWVTTGQTYGQAWESAGVDERRAILQRSRIKFHVRLTDGSQPGDDGGLWCEVETPEDWPMPSPDFSRNSMSFGV